MRVVTIQIVLSWMLVFLALSPHFSEAAPGKGGGGGRSGGGGSRSSGGGSRSSGGSGFSGSAKGGTRTTPGSSIGSGYRASRGYVPIPSTYSGGYTSATRSGYIGRGGVGFPRTFYYGLFGYWGFYGVYAYSGFYCGYSCRYSDRYNDDNGRGYYARPFDPVPPNALANPVSFSTVRNTNDGPDNRMTFILKQDTAHPGVRPIYFDESGPEAAANGPGDFTYALSLFQLVEYVDRDADGIYTPADAPVRILDMAANKWSPIIFEAKGTNDNPAKTYYEAKSKSTSAPAANNATGPPVVPTFEIIYRTSNVLINNTATVPAVTVVPNSVTMDLTITGFQFANASTRLALVTLLSSAEQFGQDPELSVADGNRTKGVQFGDKAGGRFEWLLRTESATVTGSRVEFPLPATPPAPGPDDARIIGARTETTYTQALNIVPAQNNTPIRVSMIVFLDEQILTPELSGASSAMSQTSSILAIFCAVSVSAMIGYW
ncbi:hypothetical protein DFJ77DRAFT_231430 [Powellomyces hirtus]|nr:hypothetical protein DFJ77DRAFT_231430 [Powellomyces hirtus]